MSTTSPALRFGLLALLTVQTTATVLCLRYSRIHSTSTVSESGKSESSIYLVSTLVLTMEVIKIIIVLLSLIVQMNWSIRQTVEKLYSEVFCRLSDTCQLAVPSALYIIQDNLIIYALSCLDAATYQVTYQTRIFATALFSKWLLKRQLTIQHYWALFLLFVGVILAQLHFDGEQGIFSFRSDMEGTFYFFGLSAVLCASCTSGFAGVYNEKVIKSGHQPMLLIRSFQLGLFSVIFAALGVVIKDGNRVLEQGFFHGFSSFTWFVALLQAVGGIIVAATIKYADNILKTFATAISIVLSCVLSCIILSDCNFAPAFMLGTVVIITATVLYSKA